MTELRSTVVANKNIIHNISGDDLKSLDMIKLAPIVKNPTLK